jgi:large subunit ribosomal protein L22
MEVQAQARWVRSTPRKVRFVADTLRGLPVAEALAACQFMPKAAARDVAKVIRSAQANAEHNFNLDKDDLVLKELRVEAGPIIKRGQPRAMGRLFSIFKRTSHITVVVEDRPGTGAARRRPVSGLPRAPHAPGRAPAVRPAPPAQPEASTGLPAAEPALEEETPAPRPTRTRRVKAEGAATDTPKKDSPKKEKKSK